MNNRSRETLRRVEQDDATLTEIWIGSGRIFLTLKARRCPDGVFASSQGSDYSDLGAYIGENTKLTALRDLHRGFELGPIDS